MRATFFAGAYFLFSLTSALAVPEISGHKALEADGEKYIARVTRGLKEYNSQNPDPVFIELQKIQKRNQLETLNSKVNKIISYTPDDKLYGKADHWASFDEISNSLAGDCEDYALLKYWALRKLGVPAESMHILVFYDKIVKIHHAVLVVKEGSKQMVLDNRAQNPYNLSVLSDISPNMAINEFEFFIYGKVKH